jgi:Transposase IS200 like
MAIARAHLVNPALARWYHCVTRCVRRAFLLGEGQDDRKAWIEQRLQELAQIFAVAVGGFSVMDNHLHVLLRIDPDAAKDWSDEEVVRRWGRLFPPRDQSRRPVPVSDGWVQWRLKDAPWVAKTRDGTDRRIGVRFDPEDVGAVAGITGCNVIGAHAHLARHVAKSAESNRTRNRAWQSSERTGRSGVRAC